MARLSGFLVASVALHAAAFTLTNASAFWIGGQAKTVLTMVLDGAATDGRTGIPRQPLPGPRSAATGEPDGIPPTLAGMPGSPSMPAPTEPVPESGTGTLDRARAQIEARVHTDLARHFDYPWLARQRGWQGTVLLAFVVRPNGQLDGMRIERGSGFAMLDESALDSLRRVERIPEASGWLGGRELAMHIPVLYRITGDR